MFIKGAMGILANTALSMSCKCFCSLACSQSRGIDLKPNSVHYHIRICLICDIFCIYIVSVVPLILLSFIATVIIFLTLDSLDWMTATVLAVLRGVGITSRILIQYLCFSYSGS